MGVLRGTLEQFDICARINAVECGPLWGELKVQKCNLWVQNRANAHQFPAHERKFDWLSLRIMGSLDFFWIAIVKGDYISDQHLHWGGSHLTLRP